MWYNICRLKKGLHSADGTNSMAIFRLDFEHMDLYEACVLKQTLNAALACTRELPVMFCLTNKNDVPTPGQIAFSEEVLHKVCLEMQIDESHNLSMFETLRFMLDVFRNCVDYPEETDTMTGYDYLARTHGITFTPQFEHVLTKYIGLLKNAIIH